jgi:hypothetical protein
MKNLIRKILKEESLILESGIRDMNAIAKRYKKAKIYFHEDLDGVTTAIAMKKYLEGYGIKVVDAEQIQYGEKEFAIKKPDAKGDVMPVLVDFAHGKPMFEIHTDHHDSQAGVEADTATSFRSARSNVETISQTLSPRSIFNDDDIILISTVDSANFVEHKITPEMVMNFLFSFDKDQSLKRNKMLLGLVVNKLILAYKNYPGFLSSLVLNSQPSILNILTNIRKLALEGGFISIEDMRKNQEKYIESRKGLDVVKNIGSILSQYGLGSMKKGSYDRYTPFRNNPNADFLVTALPVGMVQGSCNPYKEGRALKGVNLGEIKDELLERMSPELESLTITFGDIKRISEMKADRESVGFTLKDMFAIYGKRPSFKVNGDQKLLEILSNISNNLYRRLTPKQRQLLERVTVSGLDVIKANSGGHKCITNISGINFLYRKKYLGDEDVTPDVPEELQPIATYTGSNDFVKDIKSKLLKYGSLSDKQRDAALRQIAKEMGTETTKEPQPEKTFVDLLKRIQQEFITLLQEKIDAESN